MADPLVKESKTTILRERITNKRQDLTGSGICNPPASAYQALELQGNMCHTWFKTIVLQMLEDIREDAAKQGNDRGVKRNVTKEVSPKEILNLKITGTNEKYQTISKA